jgi:hypothetical protein
VKLRRNFIEHKYIQIPSAYLIDTLLRASYFGIRPRACRS